MKKVLLATLLFISFNATCMAEGNAENSKFDWEPVMAALIKVESNGNPYAVNGIWVGALQIAPVLVKECNRILQKRGSSKRYTLKDRYSIEKSKEMFVLIQSRYNPNNDISFAIRFWNGGPNYSIKRTQRYYNKVMRHYKKTDA